MYHHPAHQESISRKRFCVRRILAIFGTPCIILTSNKLSKVNYYLLIICYFLSIIVL